MDKETGRFYFFIVISTLLWVIVPLWVISRFFGTIDLKLFLAYMFLMYLVVPRINVWMTNHTAVGRWIKR